MSDELEITFDLSEGPQFDAVFQIDAAGTTWGSIEGEIENQEDLQAVLNLKADKIDLDADVELINQTINENYTTLNNKIDTEILNRSSADTTLQSNIDAEALLRQNADTALQGNINTLGNTVSSNYTTLDTKIDNTKNALDSDISDLSDTVTSNYNALDTRITTNTDNIATNAGNITTINSKIPNQASSSNQLADKDFVNSSIATNTANFIGTFNSVAELEAYIGTLTNNDYAFVATTDAAGNTLYDRYKYNADTQEWLYEYELNNSSFTAVQWTAINSGATASNIGQITANTSDITDLQTNKQDVLTAGTNIQINNNVISATDTTYTAGTGISIINGVISNTQTSAEWGNIQGTLSDQTDLQNALDAKQDVLTSANAGNCIEITMGGPSGLPAEYQEVKYLQSSGTQYIDTGVVLDDTMTIRIKYDFIRSGFIFGSRASLVAGYSGITNESSGIYTIRYGNTPIYSQNWIPSGTVDIVISPNGVTLNGEDVSTTAYGDSFYSGNCYLFTINQNGTPYTGEYAINRVRRFTIDNVIDLVPCKRKSDNVLGMYDLVNNEFLTNAGTGKFLTGENIEEVTKINFVNDAGYITGITSSDVTTALGYTPYNSTNPNGYITASEWGNITGTLSHQTDLQNALNGKQDTLIAGTDLEIVQNPILPSGYTALESISSTGTQYIDTEIQLNVGDIGFYVDFLTENTISNFGNFGAILGGRISSGSDDLQLSTYAGTNSGNVRYGTMTAYAPYIIIGFRTQVSLINGVLNSSNGSASQTVSSYNFTSTRPVYLFGLNNGGIFSQSGLGCTIYRAKLYSGSTIVADFVPARNNETSVLGMYDIVRDRFFTNSGSGTFVAGRPLITGTTINFTNETGYITSADLPTNHVTTDTAQSISGQKTFTSTIKSSVNNSLALTQSTGEAFGVTVKRTDANNEIKFGIGQNGDNRGIWDVRNNKWAFNIANNGKAYALGNEIAVKSDLNSLSPLRYSRYSIAQVNSTNKFIKLASMTYTQVGNRDFSYLFWVEILEASVAKCYALVRLSARWSNTNYQGYKFEILEKYGGNTSSLEALKNLTYAYSLNTTTHKITAEIWLEIKNQSYVSYYLRPTECNEYGDYSNTPVTLSNNIWTYYNQSGDASSIASTAITSGLTQVKVTDATGVRNENDLSQIIKTWTGTKAQYDAIVTKDANTLYWLTDVKIIYLGNTPVGNFSGNRNIGEIVTSTLPLTDAGLHLLDGSRLSGDGIYKGFVDYIAELYNDTKVYNPSAFTVVGSPTITDDGLFTSTATSNSYVKTEVLNLINASNYTIKFVVEDYDINNIPVGYYQFVFSDLNGTSANGLGLNISRGSSSIQIDLARAGIGNANIGYIGFSETGNIYGEIQVNGNTAKCYITRGNTVLSKNINITGYNTWSGNFVIGNRTNDYRKFYGSIDLKQFSITVDGVEVFSGSNPANYFTTEALWQQSVTTYGSCGKFVYDSELNTVRLPKVSDILQGTTDVNALGDLIKAGLPIPSHTHTRGSMNITGYLWTRGIEDIGGRGAFYDSVSSSGWNAGHGQATRTTDINFSANRSWTGSTSQPNGLPSVYGNSSTVQPQTIKAFVYIVIANSTKTEIQSDIDEIATDLNGKADTDLSNVTDTGYIKMAGAGMPSNTYIDLTLGASGTTYTAPANGWVAITVNGTGFVGVIQNKLRFNHPAGSNTSNWYSAILPVRKGQFRIDYNSITVQEFRFIYAQGSESEAS